MKNSYSNESKDTGRLKISCKTFSNWSTNTDSQAVISISTDWPDRLNALELNIRSDYYTAFRAKNPVSYSTNAEEYLFGDDKGWGNSYLCPEMPLPDSLAGTVKLNLCNQSAFTSQGVCFVHAGRAGRISPLHFDWDHKWVAHACLKGRKRFMFFPPEAGWLLNPIVNTSALCVPRFSKSDRRELIKKLGGLEVVLEAGQGILFPSLFWHGVLYEEPSLSISVRFEEYSKGRPFAVLPRSWLLQRLVWGFFQDGYRENSCKFLTDYTDLFFNGSAAWKSRYRQMNNFCRQTLLSYGQDKGVLESVGENFSSEIALAFEELRFYYNNGFGSPESIDNKIRIKEAMDYIFEAVDCFPAASINIAAYALNMRQGLLPKRGIITIIK